jgi:exodeoxyribonuclease VII small subunit
VPHSSTMADQADISDLSFEAALKELERIVGRLESGEAALQEAIDLYERGDQLRRQCAARLDAAQARIEAIRTDADGRAAGTAPFAAG